MRKYKLSMYSPHDFEFYDVVGAGGFGIVRKCALIVNPDSCIGINESLNQEKQFKITDMNLTAEKDETNVSLKCSKVLL